MHKLYLMNPINILCYQKVVQKDVHAQVQEVDLNHQNVVAEKKLLVKEVQKNQADVQVEEENHHGN